MEVTEQTFEEQVVRRSESIPVVVDFWADWCAPCKVLAPVLEQAVSAREGTVVLAKVDVDANPATAGRYGIRSIPTVLAFRGGQVVGQLVGARPRADFGAFVEKLLA